MIPTLRDDLEAYTALVAARSAYKYMCQVVNTTEQRDYYDTRPECSNTAITLKPTIIILRKHEHKMQHTSWKGWAKGATEGSASLARAFTKRAE